MLTLLAFCSLAGCGGGSNAVPAALGAGTPASTAAPGVATARFTITIPTSTATASLRRPHYVSSATQSIIITLVNVNGAAFTGTPASIASNLTTGNPACTGVPLTCTVVAPAAVGGDVYNVVTYDAQQTSLSPSTPLGQVLSQAFVAVNVAANQSNVAPPLVLNGVAASLVLTAPSDPHVIGSQNTGYQVIGNQPYVFTIAARDAAGKLIIDPGAPTFTLQSGSSAIVVTPVGGTPSAYTVQARAFSSSPVTLSASATNSAATLTVAFATIQELWVANAFNSTVTGYAMGSPPSRIDADTITSGILGPESLAVDSGGHLWVANFNGITAYSGTTQIPGNTIPGLHATAIAFDSIGILWAADFSEPSPTGSITAYSGTTQLAIDIITNPQGSVAELWGPRGLAFDSNGNLWVANGGGNVQTVTAYHGTTQITASTITGVGAPWGLAFDGSGALWVTSSSATPSINPYSGSTLIYGNTITSGLNQPAGIAFDASGNLWVANSSTGVNGSSITEYSGTSQVTGNTITAGINGPAGLTFAPPATLPFNPPPPHPSPPPPAVIANPSSLAFSVVGTSFQLVSVSQAGYFGDYSMTNSNPLVASATQSGVLVVVRPLAVGTTVIRMTGGFGQFVDIPVTVSTSGNVVVAPSSLAFTNAGAAYSQTVALSQLGYSGAFSVFIFDPTIVSASISGGTLTVTPLNSGSTVVRVGGGNSQFADVSVGVTISNVNIHAVHRGAR